ncbi:DNA methylase N-4/N-6 domain protein [Hydrogenobacter thermophilus TK-6]|uniref:site-specific DNA-methyltransferase (adenine-specific) n=2 Tax=Hydrogenobacter thermophilus TaxID=940 RepID=D3DJR2_HYDTT|nr:DNA methylase N-4/N-6 domain protein [Hydrogenobacter thermophilus TK-6]BAI70064.1 adenine-specific DNA methylase [Hydrogenobacter thermophilus TK-6]
MTKSEAKFWEVLENLYAGAEPEGKSGYINLIKQKREYFREFVKPELEEYVQERTKDFPQEFREELYHKLYTFFEPYFSDTGSIFFVKSYIYYKQYERVYTEEDVKLFWKTKDLYYLKSDLLIRSMEVRFEEEGITFYFDASQLEHKKNNEKKKLIYSFEKIDEKGRIVLKVEYSEKGRETREDEIIKDIKKKLKEEGKTQLAKDFKEEHLDKAINTFEKQTKVDYFIHKNPEQFLKEQFNLWLSQYFMAHEEVNLSPERVNQLLAIKDVAYRVIEVIARFEEELKRLWEKPRLVFNSNYVISLDRIAKKEGGLEVIKKILSYPALEEQVREWKELGMVEEDFNPKDILLIGTLNPKWQFLPIDTKYFKDLEEEIISLFDLDEELDGLLIKSENWQALNSILPRFKEKVQTIYIDPPFNKEQDADYFYEVDYKDATWATMLENRVRLGRELLRDTGSIFVRCDYNGNWIVRPLMDEIFGKENFRNEIIVNRTKKIFTGVKGYNVATDDLFFYSKSQGFCFNPQYKRREKAQKWLNMHSPGERRPPERIIFGRLFYPPKGRHWTFTQETINKMIKEGRIRINEEVEYIDIKGNKVKGMPQYLTGEDELLDSNWTDIPGYSQNQGFPTENSEILLKRVIESTSNEGDLVMDFFLGSGTTTAVAHKLKRKWIGVEMGEHFYTVVLPRMKKVLFYDKSGISKEKDVKEKYNEKSAGGFFKYYELEQFEDLLRNVEYSEKSGKEFYEEFLKNFKDYKFSQVDPFLFDKRLAKAVRVDGDDITVNFEELYPDKKVDITESIVNTLGISYKEAKNITKEKLMEFYRRVLLCL